MYSDLPWMTLFYERCIAVAMGEWSGDEKYLDYGCIAMDNGGCIVGVSIGGIGGCLSSTCLLVCLPILFDMGRVMGGGLADAKRAGREG